MGTKTIRNEQKEVDEHIRLGVSVSVTNKEGEPNAMQCDAALVCSFTESDGQGQSTIMFFGCCSADDYGRMIEHIIESSNRLKPEFQRAAHKALLKMLARSFLKDLVNEDDEEDDEPEERLQ